MHQWLVSATLWMILCILFISPGCANPKLSTDEIFINCGSTGVSVTPDGTRWLGDKHPNFTIWGSSTKSTVDEELVGSDHPVPYKAARISRSQFSYVFRLDSGQKLIRLHFNPASYNGFRKSKDLFTVEAGPFTLLNNFSASITAEALAVKFFTKEFCMVIEENRAFSITFSPTTVNGQSYDTHAFINAIEIISVPETLSYCHTGGSGVQVVGEKFLVYVDNSTALEMVHRQNVKQDSVSSGNDFRGMFRTWPGVLSKQGNYRNNITWRVSVGVGFRYLVRLHFCELGLKRAESGNMSFIIVINHMVVYTNTDVVGKEENTHGLLYRNYMVMAKGRKLEGKRDITISVQSKEEFVHGHVPLEGFEIFKLSNHDNSLASPNPLPPARDSSYWSFHDLYSILGRRDTIASAVIVVFCFVNIIVHKLRQTWEANFPEEEKKPTTKVSRTYCCFSLREIQVATKNFDAAYVIGKGGFGMVYKGFINDDPQIVAIKRLKPNSKQGKREFWTEVETLSELRHINLVSLIGYCNEQQEMILVYEYMPNGTVADHLYKLARKKSNYYVLSWEERLKICIGAGRGLDYLHTGKGVIHRDVKASNILLDETFVAKVSDFGLAKTEGASGLQNQDSTNLKGTFGYIDPDYFKSRKLTMKSDTYAFGVVLLEVLCGRPAVDPFAGEDERSLTIWARDNISRGQFDQILDPSLSGDISPYSLRAFLGVAERCLQDDPNQRPSIARVIINLEIALEQQNAKSLVPNAIASLADFFPFTDRTQQEYSKLLVTSEMTKVADILPSVDKSRLENATSLMPNERIGVADVWQRADRVSMSTMQLTAPSSPLQNTMSPTDEQTNSRILSTGLPYRKKDGRSTLMRKLSRLLPWESVRKTAKPPKRTDFAGISLSAPLSRHTNNKTPSTLSSIHQNMRTPTEGGTDDLNSTPSLKVFSLPELKAATRNFRADTIIGEGGFGRVYKGFVKEKSTDNNASGSIIAIKRLNREGFQGLQEWLSEITFLGKLRHPNLVKLLGYCLENEELLIVYDFMPNGSLENHLFKRGTAMHTIQWDVRLKILLGAARGLTYLHTRDAPVIYRDFKTSNILLGESYDAKLSDFGLAKLGPSGDHTHVSTRIMGTYGYASPEYMATGHLTVKSDVYGFGVVLLEMVTGLRVVDNKRPSGQRFLVDWIRPCFSSRKKLMGFIDSRLEGSYSPKSLLHVFQLAKNCLGADPKGRPSMQEVVEVLEAVEKLPREPRVRFNYPVASPARQ